MTPLKPIDPSIQLNEIKTKKNNMKSKFINFDNIIQFMNDKEVLIEDIDLNPVIEYYSNL